MCFASIPRLVCRGTITALSFVYFGSDPCWVAVALVVLVVIILFCICSSYSFCSCYCRSRCSSCSCFASLVLAIVLVRVLFPVLVLAVLALVLVLDDILLFGGECSSFDSAVCVKYVFLQKNRTKKSQRDRINQINNNISFYVSKAHRIANKATRATSQKVAKSHKSETSRKSRSQNPT